MRRHDSLQVTGLLLTLFLFGTCPGYAHTFDIITLKSLNEQRFGYFGASVAAAGDVNQDGFTDLVVGARGETRAYVFSGQDKSVLFELASPNPNFDSFGASVAAAGDVNQDGFADVIVGAPAFSTGPAYVFSGQDGGLLFELRSPNEESKSAYGSSVAGAGDVNRDGFADVIVGALFEDPGASPDDAGRAYVFSGQDGGVLFELISPNQAHKGHFGASVSGAGDTNGDGYADVIVAAPCENASAIPNVGRVYIFSGRDGSLLFGLASPNPSPGFGSSVATVDDINRDGIPDVIVGSQTANRAHIFSGQDGILLFELVSPNQASGGFFGGSVAGAGDVNQDGVADVIVGAEYESPPSGPESAGRAYVFSGADGGLLLELTSAHEGTGGRFGTSVAAAGDVNQDGFADVVVGARNEDPGTSPRDAGRAYVFVSRDGEAQHLE